MPRRRTAIAALCAVAAFAVPAMQATAQTGIVRIIVPFAAGGGTDALARTIAPKLAADLGQNVIVENRPGAGGQIGAAAVKAAAADGSTYLFTPDHPVVTLPHVVDKAGYDARDFVAVGQVARFALVLTAGPATGTKTMAEFAAFVKANPDRASYGVPYVGGMASTAGLAISKKLGVKMVAIPYQGSGPVVLAVAGDQVAFGITGLAEALPLTQSGKLSVLAVSGPRRSPQLPDVPTFEELGYPGLTISSWYAFFAPKALPPATAQRFNAALLKALAAPEVKQRIADLAIEYAPTKLEESAAELHKAAAFWNEAAKSPDFVRP